MTTVVNLRKEPYTVYIGRGSKWGNPFQIGKDGDRDNVCNKYEQWFWTQDYLIASLFELKNQILGCYCKPKRCHGDFLAKLANIPFEQGQFNTLIDFKNYLMSCY